MSDKGGLFGFGILSGRLHSNGKQVEFLNKKATLDIATPEFLDGLRGAVWAAENDGWCSEKDAREMVDKIDKLARLLGYSWYPERRQYGSA